MLAACLHMLAVVTQQCSASSRSAFCALQIGQLVGMSFMLQSVAGANIISERTVASAQLKFYVMTVCSKVKLLQVAGVVQVRRKAPQRSVPPFSGFLFWCMSPIVGQNMLPKFTWATAIDLTFSTAPSRNVEIDLLQPPLILACFLQPQGNPSCV